MLDAALTLLTRAPRAVAATVLLFPVAVAAVLLGVLTGAVPSPLHRVEAALDLHARAEAERMRLAQVTCVNTAHAILDPGRREARIAACLPRYGTP